MGGVTRTRVRYRRDRSTWEVVVWCRGKRILRSGFPDRCTAEAHIPDIVQEVTSDGDLAQLAAEFLSLKRAQVSAGAYQTYRISINQMLTEVGHSLSVGDVTTKMIEHLSASIRGRVSDDTARTRLKKISAFFRWCHRHHPKRCPNNPVVISDLGLRPEKFRLDFLSRSEISHLMGCLREDRRGLPLFATYVYTGGRNQEVAKLLWKDLNLREGFVNFRDTKSGRDRQVPLHPHLREILTTWKGDSRWDDFVFPSGSTGGRLRPQSIERWWKKTLEAAELPDYRVHDLRHTAISHWVMAGVDLRTVQTWAGHSSLRETLRYSHLSPEHTVNQMKKLGSGFRVGDTPTPDAQLRKPEDDNGLDGQMVTPAGFD